MKKRKKKGDQSESEADELRRLRARYADDIHGRLGLRARIRRLVAGPGPGLVIAGAAIAMTGAGLVEAAWGSAVLLGWTGVFAGKIMAGIGMAVGARDVVLGALESGDAEDALLLAEAPEEIEDEE